MFLAEYKDETKRLIQTFFKSEKDIVSYVNYLKYPQTYRKFETYFYANLINVLFQEDEWKLYYKMFNKYTHSLKDKHIQTLFKQSLRELYGGIIVRWIESF